MTGGASAISNEIAKSPSASGGKIALRDPEPNATVPMGFQMTVPVEDFQALALVLGVSCRNAAAMYYKVAFRYVRAGTTKYRDGAI